MAEPETIRQGTIEVDSDQPDDEGYQESSTGSLLSSIASEIREGKVENGRVYAAYGEHGARPASNCYKCMLMSLAEYGLPIDDDELDRLDLNHSKYYMLMQNNHHLAPLQDDIQNILDIGTGTGIWAIDMADKFPSASVCPPSLIFNYL